MRTLLSVLFALIFTPLLHAQAIESVPEHLDTTFILRTYIAGLKHHLSRRQYEALKPGEALMLKAEPDNKYDKHAIAIYKGGDKIGFIPAQEAEALGETLSLSPLIAVITKTGMDGSESAMSVSISVRRE